MKKSLLIICIVFSFSQLFSQGIDKPRYQLEIHRAGTFLGNIQIELFPLIAPLATNYFDSLVAVQAYDSTAFHRVVPGFVIQGGDPNSINGPVSTWGYGNPNQPTVNAEFSVVQHLRGRIGAARDADTNSANSQFYICAAAALFLDGNYTVYGQVTSGLNWVDTIVNSPRDINDVPLQKIEMFITTAGVNDSIPDAPALNAPADGSTGVLSTQSFQWSVSSQAVMYRLEFSTDSSFNTINFKINTATTSKSFAGLAGYTKYYWRVIANNGGHESVSSPIYSFTTAVGGPQLVMPADSTNGINLNPVFNWNAGAGANNYKLQVAKFATFATGVLVYTQSGITGTSHQMTPTLLPNNKYFWRVQSFDGINAGNYSQKFMFYTGTTLGLYSITGNTKAVELKAVYPNPARDYITVDCILKTPAAVNVTLRNSEGKTVFTSITDVASNQFVKTIDVSDMRKGTYIITVSCNGYEAKEKVEIL